MEWPMSRVEEAQEEIENANDNKIRHFKVLPFVRFQPEKNVIGEWEICSSKTVANFSAAAYFFSKNIRQKYDVPVGLVNSTRGESNIKMWLPIESIEALNRDELLKHLMENRISRLEKKYQFSSTEQDLNSQSETWIDSEYNDEKWNNIQLPLSWGESDFREMLGKIWYRKTFFLEKLPSENLAIKFSLAQIDDADVTFLNGQKIGEGKQVFDKVRKYEIDPTILKKGKNVMAISIENYQAFGGIFGNQQDLFLEIGDRKIPLAGEWKMKIEILNYNQEWLFEKGMIPSVLYNTMIYPLQKMRFRAVLWYQGETDTMNDNAKLFEYRFLFMKLISSWRSKFGNQELPFIFAQLSNAMSSCVEPSDSLWARLRESQSQALQLKNTAQVINIDCGKHENTVHPQNKKELGRRFSLAVQKLAFGENVIANGPVLKNMKIEGKYIYVYFSNVAKALLLKNGNEVKELAIAGNDKKFFWAKSRVETNRIIVWNDKISDPVAVRYAWCDNPLEVNLYNSEGLPAGPFRTDDW
jgi:sialate O-acetylesterase